MPARGNARTFHDKFLFRVIIDGFESAAFQKCSELSVEIGKIEYREGGRLTPDKSPGLLNFTDVTLERGSTSDEDMYAWFLQVADAARGDGGLGSPTPDYKRSVVIRQLDRDGAALRDYVLYDAWPTKFVAGEWDNEGEEKNIEMLTLTYDHFESVPYE